MVTNFVDRYCSRHTRISPRRVVEFDRVWIVQQHVIGGHNGSFLGTVERYRPITSTWKTQPSVPTARCCAGTGVIDETIYVVGGYNGQSLRTSESFTPWTLNSDCYERRAAAGRRDQR